MSIALFEVTLFSYIFWVFVGKATIILQVGELVAFCRIYRSHMRSRIQVFDWWASAHDEST
jgi:hypothetical protein